MVANASPRNYQKPIRFPSLLGPLHQFRRGFTRASPALHLRFTCASPLVYPLFSPMPSSFPHFSWLLQLDNDTLPSGMRMRAMFRLRCHVWLKPFKASASFHLLENAENHKRDGHYVQTALPCLAETFQILSSEGNT